MGRPPTYSEFVQTVRRYRTSDVVTSISRIAATWGPNFGAGSVDMKLTQPWALAAIAKESILHGNEHRHAKFGADEISHTVRVFNEVGEPTESISLEHLLTAYLHEQFPYQESISEELGRAIALLVDPYDGCDPIDWNALIGTSLEAAIRASITLEVIVVNGGGGEYVPAVLDQDNVQEVFTRLLPRSDVEAVAAYLSSTRAELQSHAAAAPQLPSAIARFGFNPLMAKPIVTLDDGHRWVPLSGFIPRAFTPANLYYPAMQKWGSAYSENVGRRTELYVGRQLKQIEDLVIEPEITYGRKDGEKSVDWIIVLPNLVLLVEVKSGSPTLDAKAGGASLVEIVARYIGKARGQIEKTANLVSERHSKFAHLPVDRPIYGLAVTGEPFYLANSGLDAYTGATNVPTKAVSLREIEYLSCLSVAQLEETILSTFNKPELLHQQVVSAIPLDRLPENALLQASWSAMDWEDGSR